MTPLLSFNPNVFPASAGMNRTINIRHINVTRVPRIRGDEP